MGASQCHQPVVGYGFSDIDAQLKCPVCAGEYLHQGRVIVKNRGEDRDGVLFDIDGDAVLSRLLKSDEGDGRRQSIRIEFDCESCGDGLWLFIMQHKGLTLFHWSVEHRDRSPERGL